MKVLPYAEHIALYIDFLTFILTATSSIGNPPIFSVKKVRLREVRSPGQDSTAGEESELRFEGRSAWPLTRDAHPAGHNHSAAPLGRSVMWGKPALCNSMKKIENNRGYLT